MSQSSCSSLQIEAFTSPEAFQDLEAEWRALMARSAHAHPFYDPAWHAAWWRNFGAGELRVYALRDETGALTGVAPFVLSEGGRAGREGTTSRTTSTSSLPTVRTSRAGGRFSPHSTNRTLPIGANSPCAAFPKPPPRSRLSRS